MRTVKESKESTFLPTLTTKHLILRCISMWDAEDMYDYAKEEQTTEYLLWSPHKSLTETREHIAFMKDGYRKGTCYDYAVILSESDTMIGTCGFVYVDNENKKAEVGYVLHPQHWGKGYGTEALQAVIDYGFHTLDLHRIEARYMIENIASRTVMKKAGMTFEGVLRKSLFVKGKFRDIGVCSILRSEQS